MKAQLNKKLGQTLRRLSTVVVLLYLAACEQGIDTHKQAMLNLQTRTQELNAEFQPCTRDSTTALPALVARSRCLVFTTAENPAAPQGRQIQLQVMVVPAISPLPEPDPFVILVGGPGQAATMDALPILPIFQGISANRDIVLIDQRGTGKLSPFNCDFGEESTSEASSTQLLLEIQTQYLQDCLAAIDAQPQYYTTDIAVQDLDAIRAYLGYSQLNLWGVSYGTRVALAYLKYFPATTRTVVIDGVAPPGILPLQAARDGGRALSTVMALCAAELECAAVFPLLETHYAELMQRYVVPVDISVRDQTTGLMKNIELSSAVIQSNLFMMLYSRELTRLLPLFIEQLYQGNFQGLNAMTSNESAGNIGMHYSVICSEDLPLIAAADLAAAQADDSIFVYDLLVASRVEGCKVWPSRTLAPDFFTPVVSDKPVLIFSATQDPVTPQRWGDLVAATLSNSRHLVATGVGHGVFAYGCAAELITEFVDSAALQDLDTDCLNTLATRPFFVTTGGSAAADD